MNMRGIEINNNMGGEKGSKESSKKKKTSSSKEDGSCPKCPKLTKVIESYTQTIEALTSRIGGASHQISRTTVQLD